MADRPILFSAPMIRAILAGSKTQTRRILKPQPELAPSSGVEYWTHPKFPGGYPADVLRAKADRLGVVPFAPGDLLWVREGFMPAPMTANHENDRPTQWNIAYAAGGRAEAIAPAGYNPMLYNYERWSPSIHMPRWASRITLRVTDVKVERLQDISEADAKAEGIIRQDPTPEDEAWNVEWCEENGIPLSPMEPVWIAPGTRQGWGMTREQRSKPQWGPSPQFAFRCLWESINGPGSWDANPWVAVIAFQPVFKNIDEVKNG